MMKLAKKLVLKYKLDMLNVLTQHFKSALDYINQPLFIESHRLAEFNPRGTDVPVVLDLMIHDLDIVLKLVNSPVKMFKPQEYL